MKMPETIAGFLEAFNDHDPEKLSSFMNDNAVVNDEGHDYRGVAEIKKWYEEKAVGPKVTLEPVNVVESNGKTIVTNIVDGNFDKTGLPDPLKLDFYFTINSKKVASLSIHFPETPQT